MIRNLAILTLLVFSNVFFGTYVLASDSSKLNVDVNVAGNDEQIVEKETLDPNQSIINEGSERLAQVNEMRSEIRALKIQIERAKGENKFALEFELQEKVVSTMDQLFGLAGVLERQNEAGIDTENLRDEVVSLVITASNAADQAIDTAIDAFPEVDQRQRNLRVSIELSLNSPLLINLNGLRCYSKRKGKRFLK